MIKEEDTQKTYNVGNVWHIHFPEIPVLITKIVDIDTGFTTQNLTCLSRFSELKKN